MSSSDKLGGVDRLRSDLGKLLEFEMEQFADARLICFDLEKIYGKGWEYKREEIPVHRAILTARCLNSEFFAGESDTLEIPKKYEPWVIRALLSFAYTDKDPGEGMDLDEEDLDQLQKAADFFGLDISQSNPDNELSKQLQKLHETGQFSDAKIVYFDEFVGGNVAFPVHKCVLAARSKFFNSAFSVVDEENEGKTAEVVVAPELGFSPDTIRAMLSYIYTATIAPGLEQPTLIELLKAAHYYQIESLIIDCELTFDGCMELLLYADAKSCRPLMEKALEFLRKNAEGVKSASGWRCLMESPSKKELKALCDHWMGVTPVTLENFADLLCIYDFYGGNWRLVQRSLDFVLENEEAIRESDGWRLLMQTEDELDRNVSPKNFYGRYVWQIPLTVENCTEVYHLAHEVGNTLIRNSAQMFMFKNLESVEQTDSFRRLMESNSSLSRHFKLCMKTVKKLEQ